MPRVDFARASLAAGHIACFAEAVWIVGANRCDRSASSRCANHCARGCSTSVRISRQSPSTNSSRTWRASRSSTTCARATTFSIHFHRTGRPTDALNPVVVTEAPLRHPAEQARTDVRIQAVGRAAKFDDDLLGRRSGLTEGIHQHTQPLLNVPFVRERRQRSDATDQRGETLRGIVGHGLSVVRFRNGISGWPFAQAAS
jgi:hypothetical protein